ncbi:MAG: FkbM family methyltransferase [Ferruginibacter sp.]
MKKQLIKIFKAIRHIVISINKTIYKKQYREIFELINPQIIGVRKEVFGKQGDGTYILPVDLIEDSADYKLLSFGISNDISFEKDFYARFKNIGIYAFDPTIDELPEKNDHIKFFKIGLAGRNITRKGLFTLSEIIRKLDLSNQYKYILKIDIEGWEWEFLSEVDFELLDIPILAIELHFSPFPRSISVSLPYTFYKNKYKILKKLLRHYYIHHIHANNDHYTKFDDFVFPTFLELTLIRKNIYNTEIMNDIQNLHVRPNKINKPDYQYPFKAE